MSEYGPAREGPLAADFSSVRFRIGVDNGRWRLEELKPPRAIVIVAASRLQGAPDEFGFLFDLSGYPQTPPAARLWDVAADTPLAVADWPVTARSDSIFRPGWKTTAIYHPYDRVAQAGHDTWRQQSPRHWWTPERHIVDYLQMLWAVLNGSDYVGVQRAAA